MAKFFRKRSVCPIIGVPLTMAFAVVICMFIVPGVSLASSELEISNFTINATNATDEPYTQAGGHPYELTTNIDFNTEEVAPGRVAPVQDPKDIGVDFPPGLIGDPQAVPRCPLAVFEHGGEVHCPGSTQVGTVISHLFGGNEFLDSLYNLTPPTNTPALFGYTTPLGVNFLLTAGVRTSRTGEGYRVTTVDSGVPIAELASAEVTLWGSPANPSHDTLRGANCFGTEFCIGGNESSGDPEIPFVTLPTDCAAGAPQASMYADSWEEPGQRNADGTPDFADPRWKHATASLPAPTGCNLLAFHPGIEVKPETTQVDEPDGLDVGIEVPQTESPSLYATPDSARYDCDAAVRHVDLPVGGRWTTGVQRRSVRGVVVLGG